MTAEKSKVFLLGLDGVSLPQLEGLAGRGVVPELAGVLENSARGPLTTVFPPVTAPAWLALATGLNPGRTGVFDYINRREPGGHLMTPVSSAYYEGRSLWDLLGTAGWKVGVFNYPTLAPPPRVRGFAVSGMGAGRGPGLAWPAELAARLEGLPGGWESHLNLRNPRYHEDIGLFFRDVGRIAAKQIEALGWLMKEQEWDFLFAVFSFTDWMNHVAWRHLDEAHPMHDPVQARFALEGFESIWRQVDGFVGWLRKSLPPDALLMLVSDHGSGPLDSVFYPNAWLREKGWLVEKGLGWKGAVARRLRLFAEGSDSKYADRLAGFVRRKVLGLGSSVDLIDLERSLVYSPEHNTMFGCLNLTERGRSEPGFVGRLARDLERLPSDVEGVSEVKVLSPADLYRGPRSSLAPDLLFIVNGYRATVEIDLAGRAFSPRPSLPTRTGGHRPEGLFAACGEPFRTTRLGSLSILDVAPTVLALCGLAIPQEMDGRVVSEALRRESGIKPARAAEDQRLGGVEEGRGDLEGMKDILRSLGYL